MIWDCFLYNQEAEVLQIRMKELQGLEIIHVAVQSDKTFTGKPKQVTNLFNVPSVIQVHVTDMPDNCDAWTRETHQRNAIMRGLKYAKDDDIVIISDVDEIPSRAAVESYKPEMGTAALVLNMYYYWFNCRESLQQWKPAKMLTYVELKKSTPDAVRNAGHQTEIPNAGNHFSWLGDKNFAFNKVQSFSHQEFNIPGLTPEAFEYKIQNCEDFCTQKRFEVVDIDETFPIYLREHPELFQHLIKQKI